MLFHRTRRLSSLMKLGIVLGWALLFIACSTTRHLPEDDQLYIGTEAIDFVDSPEQIYQDALAAQPHKNKAQKRALKAERDKAQTSFDVVREEVEAVLAYPPNGSLFGSSSLRSPLPIGLWIYNGLADKKGSVAKWILRKFGSEPITVSSVSPEVRTQVATNTLHNYGYFQGRVDYDVVTQKNARKAKINYKVKAGALWHLDSVYYGCYGVEADSLLELHRGKRLLKKGDAFSVVNLADEQTRIASLLRENGYYFFTPAYTTYRADTLQRSGWVQLQVVPQATRPDYACRPWYIGNTYITVRNTESDILNKMRQRRDYTYYYTGDKLPLRGGMWRRSISHRKGELYRQRHEEQTFEKLSSLGVFSQLDVSYVMRDSSATCDTLDIYVTALMDKLYDSSFETNVTFKSNQQVGPGVKFGLAKRNAFGGGEKVAFEVFGSYEWQTGLDRKGDDSMLNSYELGTKLSFEFPRFVFPGIGRKYFRFPATTTFSLNADWKNRAGFFNMVTMGVDATYRWNLLRTSKHEFTLLSLDFDKMLHTTASFNEIMTDNPALQMSMRDQFVPSISYTYTYAAASTHRNPVWLQLSVKEAGNVVSGIYAACGQSFHKRDKQLFENPFAQFVKATAEFHEKFRINRRFSLATRLYGGIIYSYGNATRAPYSDQFYVGGANSVRGFTVRTIGPGSYRSNSSKYAYIDQTGDFKLEANLELRALLFGDLHGAVFLDAGNVWLLRNDPSRPGAELNKNNFKKMAVGTGFGLRYDLQFIVLRFDVGIPLHAPYDTNKSGWMNISHLGRKLAYHLAIGYPF